MLYELRRWRHIHHVNLLDIQGIDFGSIDYPNPRLGLVSYCPNVLLPIKDYMQAHPECNKQSMVSY